MKVEIPSLWTAGQSLILTRLIFYSPARWREIIDQSVKAPHNRDWTVAIHVITNTYLEWTLLLLNSDYGAMQKILSQNKAYVLTWSHLSPFWMSFAKKHSQWWTKLRYYKLFSSESWPTHIRQEGKRFHMRLPPVVSTATFRMTSPLAHKL